MENKEKLPWELVEEILSRVPPKPLVRFRTVCKRWNTLFDDNTFINNHKMTSRFILVTKSKVYSVSLNAEIEVRELTLDIPRLEDRKPNDLFDCNGFFLCGMKGAVVCNPWLGQSRCIKAEVNQPSFEFRGIGYDHDRIDKKIVYKTLAFYRNDTSSSTESRIHDLATDTWIDVLKEAKHETLPPKTVTYMHSTRGVSLNGTLYWVAYYQSHPWLFVVVSFNFGSARYIIFCGLPCEKNDRNDALVLRVFRGDRFSLLKQCHVTKKIQIWVAKDKIDNGYSRADVKWRSFMEVSIPNFPYLVETQSYHQPSYYIDDKRDGKRLVVCSCDVDGRAWIYVVGESKLISKTLLDSVVDPWPLHCTFVPSLVMVPGCQREDKEQEKAELRASAMFFVWLFGKLKFLFSKINYCF